MLSSVVLHTGQRVLATAFDWDPALVGPGDEDPAWDRPGPLGPCGWDPGLFEDCWGVVLKLCCCCPTLGEPCCCCGTFGEPCCCCCCPILGDPCGCCPTLGDPCCDPAFVDSCNPVFAGCCCCAPVLEGPCVCIPVLGGTCCCEDAFGDPGWTPLLFTICGWPPGLGEPCCGGPFGRSFCDCPFRWPSGCVPAFWVTFCAPGLFWGAVCPFPCNCGELCLGRGWPVCIGGPWPDFWGPCCCWGPLPGPAPGCCSPGGFTPCWEGPFLFLSPSPSSPNKPNLFTAEDTALRGLAPLRNLEENIAGSSSSSQELESTGLSESEQELSPLCPGSPAEAWGGAGSGAVERASTAPLLLPMLLLLLLLPGLSSGSASTSDFLNAWETDKEEMWCHKRQEKHEHLWTTFAVLSEPICCLVNKIKTCCTSVLSIMDAGETYYHSFNELLSKVFQYCSLLYIIDISKNSKHILLWFYLYPRTA